MVNFKDNLPSSFLAATYRVSRKHRPRKHRPRNLKLVLRPTHLMKTVYAWCFFLDVHIVCLLLMTVYKGSFPQLVKRLKSSLSQIPHTSEPYRRMGRKTEL